MGRTSGTLDSIMRLKEEVPIMRFGDASVHNEASLRVAVRVGTNVALRREEAGMMSFADDDESESGPRCADAII